MHPLIRLVRYVGPHKKWAALTFVFGGIGFLLSFAYPWIIGQAVDVIVAHGDRDRLVHLTELAALVALLHAFVVYARGHCNVHLGHSIVVDLRCELFEHLQRLSMLFYAKERTGSILARILGDVHEATSLIYMGLIVVALDAIQLCVAVVLLAKMSFALTLACVLLFPLYALVFKMMNPRVHLASDRMHTVFNRITGNVSERLAGQALIKTYTAESREAALFANDLEHHHSLVLAQSHEGHLVASSGEILVHAGTTIVIGFGGFLALGGEMTPGTMTRFLGYMLVMFGPVRRFAELNVVYQSSLSAMRRVFRLLEIRPNVTEARRPLRSAPRKGHVSFEDVRFRYPEDTDEARVRLDDDSRDLVAHESPWVIDGVSLEARPGELVAIVGPSGAGKTTLLSLLPRLYDVTEGHVRVDGKDVREYALKSLRSSIAVVAQDSFVFTGSVRDNIAYGRPDATDEDIVRAAKAAHAHEFISRLEKGYESRLGERGINLSGGQRQRISIARALLKDPRILILDEATSSLDTESEAIVQEALERLMDARTCFVIAHRLSTIRHADRICVLENGKLVESGTHDALIRRGGAYARLVGKQAPAA